MVYGLEDSDEIERLPSAASTRVSLMAAIFDVPHQVEARIGDIATILRELAKRWRADVVVVGRGRQTDRWQFSSNIGEIIVQSPCPVITCCSHLRFAGPIWRSRKSP
jgi:nucleotide-binding universal stress UspA family protein